MDPPWKVRLNCKDRMDFGGGYKLPYKTMTDDEIMQFDINQYADNDCDLFVWTTNSKLPFTIKLVEYWGFKYYCAMVWKKNTGITLNGFFNNAEFVVYAYRGPYAIPKRGNAINTCFFEKTTRHSEKPDGFYTMILEKTRDPRIDLFARKKHYGFDTWGDEVDNKQTILQQAGEM